MRRVLNSNCWITDSGVPVTQWGNPLKTIVNQHNGYVQTSIVIDGKWVTRTVHRLVAVAYLGLDAGNRKVQVNHKDGDKTNNHPDNLELCSPSENTSHYHTNKWPYDNETQVQCRRCMKVLPHSEYHRASSKKWGVNPICKTCRKV